MGSVPRVREKGGGTCFGNNVAEMDEGSPGEGETKRSLMEGGQGRYSEGGMGISWLELCCCPGQREAGLVRLPI